ncbi:hypothetical protein [Streptomyces sp. NPDC096339]|uniref:RCC1 domain-containing protein n=1 Tax=Streptomyces sp. NPDC096339 TaxID=3366086 RepID=UPI0038174A16
MSFTFRGRSTGRRVAAACVAALLWSGLPAGAWLSTAHAADAGRSIEPGTAVSWGANLEGQLGDGTTVTHSRTPVRVCGSGPCPSPLDHVVAVSGGAGHSLALRADGTVIAWGNNTSGQLGDGTRAARATPVRVCAPGEVPPCENFLTNITAVAAGAFHSLALRADGLVFAWGENFAGQLGDGTHNPSNTPIPVGGLDNITAIAAGALHSLALRTDGTAHAWGGNEFGQLGDGTNTDRDTPVPVLGFPIVSAIAAGSGGVHSLARQTDGTVIAWGLNESGQLGNGTNTSSNMPVQVSGLTNVAAIAAGTVHSLALRSDGTARAWGANDVGQLGNSTNSDSNTPVQVSGLTNVTAVSAGASHSLALRSDGTARAWGFNNFGQLGNGTITNANAPVQVCSFGQTAPCNRFLDGVTAISAGGPFSLAVIRPSADLAVAISASPEPVQNDRNLTYTVTVRNNGPTAADAVVLSDDLPANARFVSAAPSQGTCQVPPAGSTNSVTCSLGTLASGATATTQIVVTVRTARGGTVTNTATVTASTPDPNQTNNNADIQTAVS